MKARLLINLVLLIIVLSLAWFGYFKEQQHSQQRVSSQLTQLDANQIKQITIEKAETKTYFNKQANDWYISQPFSAKASPSRVGLLLSLLNSQVHRQIQTNDQGYLTRFGLDKPKVIIHFDQHQFSLGEVEPLSKHRYVLYNNTVYLVDDTVMSLLRASAESYIDNHLLAADTKLAQLELPAINPQGEFTGEMVLIRLSDGQWQADKAQFSTDALVTLVDNWQYAQAMQVKHANTDMTAGTKTIRLWLTVQAEPIEIPYTVQASSLQLQHAGLLYIFPTNTLAELFPIIK